MGVILSRLRKKPSTKELLKNIQEEIQSLEEYKERTEQTRRKLVNNLVAFSSVSYVVAGVIFYFYYMPTRWEDRLMYLAFFALALILIYLTKNFLTCYYRWKVRRNEKKLVSLKAKKEDILDQVMETETYKVAKDILETFAPEQIKKGTVTIKTTVPSPTTPGTQKIAPSPATGGEVRRRIVSPQATRTYAPRVAPSPGLNVSPYARPMVASPRTSDGKVALPGPLNPLARTPFPARSSPPLSRSFNWSSENGSLRSDITTIPGADPPGPPMPRPILPRERGVLDRFIEYLVGDGPSNRYALVCRQCESHNGMALKEEFPYVAFRCAYCFYWNPARKQKPAPPKLNSNEAGGGKYLADLDDDSEGEEQGVKGRKEISNKEDSKSQTALDSQSSAQSESSLAEESETKSKSSVEDLTEEFRKETPVSDVPPQHSHQSGNTENSSVDSDAKSKEVSPKIEPCDVDSTAKETS